MKLSATALPQFFLKNGLAAFETLAKNGYQTEDIQFDDLAYQKAIVWSVKSGKRDVFNILMDYPYAGAKFEALIVNTAQRCLKSPHSDMAAEFIEKQVHSFYCSELARTLYNQEHDHFFHQKPLVRQLMVIRTIDKRPYEKDEFFKWLPLAQFDQEPTLITPLLKELILMGEFAELDKVGDLVQHPHQWTPAVLELLRYDDFMEISRCALTIEQRKEVISFIDHRLDWDHIQSEFEHYHYPVSDELVRKLWSVADRKTLQENTPSSTTTSPRRRF